MTGVIAPFVVMMNDTGRSDGNGEPWRVFVTYIELGKEQHCRKAAIGGSPSSAPVPGSALQADFTRAVLAAGEDVKFLRSVPASRLWTIALLAMWRHPSFQQQAPAIHHRLIIASSAAPVSNPEIAEEELFFGRRPLSFDVGGRLVRILVQLLSEPRKTTHISLPLGLRVGPYHSTPFLEEGRGVKVFAYAVFWERQLFEPRRIHFPAFPRSCKL